ncbi:hypothetical protein [Pseudonocardia zijingensis]|jgi:hypothetical protein|uniref:DUF2786 domain-containing protein n=1 Tax=Pseudonocardia zijingensis TaxID=153376 RepID=A0ABP3ZME5_9PSEU
MRPDPAALHGAAFADGRRLRDRAQRRRAHHEMRMARRRAHRFPKALAFALLVVAATVAGDTVLKVGAVVLLVLAIVLVTTPALVVGGTAIVLTRHVRRRRAAVAPRTAPDPARPEVVWAKARERFTALRAEYGAFECDPMAVLRLPALADVSVPSTARFVDAFAEAQALETDAFPPAEHARSFVAAVDRAERAWRAATEAAERIRHSGLSPAERATVERVIKLLTTARDSDSDPERLAAYARARSELAKLDSAGVVHLPRTARAALDEAARGALPA